MKTWSGEQLGRFLESVRQERLYAMWLVLATSGARRGEVLGLRWTDVNLESGRVQIARSANMVDHKITFAAPKTEKSRRTISLDPTTIAALRSHKAGQAEERLAWGPAYSDQGLVFAQENGEPLNPEYVSKKFVKLGETAGLPRVRVHDLRHGWATMALAAGVHPKVVQERLGHSSIVLTLSVYSHTLPAMETAAAQQVASLIFGDLAQGNRDAS
jgi:integrase